MINLAKLQRKKDKLKREFKKLSNHKQPTDILMLEIQSKVVKIKKLIFKKKYFLHFKIASAVTVLNASNEAEYLFMEELILKMLNSELD